MLERSDHGTRHPLLSALLTSAARWRLLDVAPVTRLVVHPKAGAETVEDRLSVLLSRKVRVGVRFGRARAHRAIVLQVFGDDGGTLAFVKASATPESVRALSAEHDNLVQASNTQVEGLEAPRVLGYESWGGLTLLVLSPLSSNPGEQVSAGDKPPVSTMRRFAVALGTTSRTLAASSFLEHLAREVEEVQSESARETLVEAIQALREACGDVELEFGQWHGDWVPWNMIATPTSLRLWDWEHVQDDVPLGFDVLHYRAQQLRNATQPNTFLRAERVWLDEAPALLAPMGVPSERVDCTVVCYLVKINSRYIRETQRSPGPVSRNGWGLQLLQRLAETLREGGR
jgi:hypothetical protein